MLTSASILLSLAFSALSLPNVPTGFEDTSLRTIKFSPHHVERLPLGAIEHLRGAPPLPRPLTSESFAAARESLASVSAYAASTISDEAIERLQGYFQRNLWGPGYVDITDSGLDSMYVLDEDDTQTPLLGVVKAPKYPTPDPSAHPELKPMLEMVNSTEIKAYVTQLSTAYQTRYYRSRNARGEFKIRLIFLYLRHLNLSFILAPTKWIESQFASWLGSNQTYVVENAFNQPNVIGRIEAKSGNASAPIVILGAHLDSTSQMPAWKAPGADDGEPHTLLSSLF